MHGVSDATIRQIGRNISTNLDELASAFDVGYADLKRYKDSNYGASGVTADGTIRMLFEWRRADRTDRAAAKTTAGLEAS